MDFFQFSFLLWYNTVLCLRLVEGYAGLCFYYYHFWVYRCIIYSFICLLFFIIIKENIKTLVWLCVYLHTHITFLRGHTSKHWLPLAFGNSRQGVGREIFTFNFAVLCFLFFFFLVIMHYITKKKSQGKKEKKNNSILVLFPVEVILLRNLSHLAANLDINHFNLKNFYKSWSGNLFC